jgi:hypothetical protein
MRYFNNALEDRRVFYSIDPSVGDSSSKYKLRSDLTKGVPLPKSPISTTDIATTTTTTTPTSSDVYHSGNASAIKTQANNERDPLNMTVWTIAGAVKIENGEVDQNKIIEQTMAAHGTLNAGFSGIQPVTGLDNLRQMRYEFEIARAEENDRNFQAALARDAAKEASNNPGVSGNNTAAQIMGTIFQAISMLF